MEAFTSLDSSAVSPGVLSMPWLCLPLSGWKGHRRPHGPSPASSLEPGAARIHSPHKGIFQA